MPLVKAEQFAAIGAYVGWPVEETIAALMEEPFFECRQAADSIARTAVRNRQELDISDELADITEEVTRGKDSHTP